MNFGAKSFFLTILVALVLTPAVWLGAINRCGIADYEREFEASRTLKICAAAGYPRAQAFLGLLYLVASEDQANFASYKLDPVEPPQTLRERALELMYAAAERGGGGVAQNEIGLAYLEGTFGFEQDYGKAREWFQKALEAGSELAGFNLARVYAHGLGVAADLETATSYLARSAQLRYCPAREALAKLEAAAESDKFAVLREVATPRFSPDICFDTGLFPKTRRKVAEIAGRIERDIRLKLERFRLNHFKDKKVETAITPDPQTCAVFRNFLGEIARGEKIYVRPVTMAYTELYYSEDVSIPNVFYIDSGDTEIVELYDGQSVERSVHKEVEIDTSGFFNTLKDTRTYSVSDCFEEGQQEVEFWSGSLDLLVHEKSEEKVSEDVTLMAIWSLSPVGISDDGQIALLYAEYYCGALCASGDYYLLKRSVDDGHWRLFGVHPIWVS